MASSTGWENNDATARDLVVGESEKARGRVSRARHFAANGDDWWWIDGARLSAR